MSSSPRPAPAAASLWGQGLRFLSVGALNTLGTLLLYQLLLFVMPYTPAYVVAWGAGLVFVNLAYPLYVYGKALAGRDSVWNTGYYLLSFAASWLLLQLITAGLGVAPRLSVFCVLAVMVPINFLVTRYIYRPVAGPRYAKPKRITGHKLSFRDASPADAGFIVSLRTDPAKSRYLSATSGDVAKQAAWLEDYARDGSQVYFIMEDAQGAPVGTVRLYDACGDSFCWGSWIIKADTPGNYAIESALMVYRYALSLGFTRGHFEVRKDNQSVWRFHERFGAVRTGETEQEFLYAISGEAIAASLDKYARYLPQGIRVEP